MVKDEPALWQSLPENQRDGVLRMAKAMCNQSGRDEGDGLCTCETDGGSCVAFGLYGSLAWAAMQSILELRVKET